MLLVVQWVYKKSNAVLVVAGKKGNFYCPMIAIHFWIVNFCGIASTHIAKLSRIPTRIPKWKSEAINYWYRDCHLLALLVADFLVENAIVLPPQWNWLQQAPVWVDGKTFQSLSVFVYFSSILATRHFNNACIITCFAVKLCEMMAAEYLKSMCC